MHTDASSRSPFRSHRSSPSNPSPRTRARQARAARLHQEWTSRRSWTSTQTRNRTIKSKLKFTPSVESSCCLWSATGLELRYKSQRCWTSASLPLSNSKNRPSCSKTETTKPPSNSCAPIRPSTLTARKGSSTSEARALSMYVTYPLKSNTTQNHSTSNSKMDPPKPSCSKVKRTMRTCTSANHTSKWTTPTW